MKYLLILLFSIFAHFSYAQSQNGADILKLAVASLPPCALQCTITTIAASSCELTDIGCIKSNKKLLNDLSVCVKSSCSIKEALTAKKFLQTLLGAPIRDKTALGTFTSLIVGGVAVLAFILRAITRLPAFSGNWGPDDWVITAAIIIIIPLTICAYLLNQLGLGTDMWFVPFDNITQILKIFYVTELLYLASIGLTKISILLFYLRIFPNRTLRRAIWFTIILCVLYIITFVTATALQCIPIRIAWEHWDGEHHGKCINLNVDAWISAGVNIVLDLIVISLPMGEIRKLAMSRRRKFGVMLMFLGGGFVTVVSILRLEYLIQFAHTENVTWDYLPIGYWSAVETHVGVIVACLPAIRSLIRCIRERLFPKKPATTSYYEDDTRNSSKKNSHKNSNSRTWSSKTEKSRLSTLNRGKVDKEDFVRLDEYEMDVGAVAQKESPQNRSPSQTPSGMFSARSYESNEDVLPLTTTAAPIGQPSGGIVVQTDYSVDTASLNSGQAQKTMSEEELTDKRRFRF